MHDFPAYATTLSASNSELCGALNRDTRSSPNYPCYPRSYDNLFIALSVVGRILYPTYLGISTFKPPRELIKELELPQAEGPKVEENCRGETLTVTESRREEKFL